MFIQVFRQLNNFYFFSTKKMKKNCFKIYKKFYKYFKKKLFLSRNLKFFRKNYLITCSDFTLLDKVFDRYKGCVSYQYIRHVIPFFMGSKFKI